MYIIYTTPTCAVGLQEGPCPDPYSACSVWFERASNDLTFFLRVHFRETYKITARSKFVSMGSGPAIWISCQD